MDVPVYFILEKFGNGIFIPKHDNYSVMPAYMCTKPCPVPIISCSTKCITGFILYPTIDT